MPGETRLVILLFACTLPLPQDDNGHAIAAPVFGGKAKTFHCRKGPQKIMNLTPQSPGAASVDHLDFTKTGQQRLVHKLFQFCKGNISTKPAHVKAQ